MVLVVTLLVVITPSTLLAGPKLKVGVLYPEVKSQALTQIFEEIIEGIISNHELEVSLFIISDGDDLEQIERDIKHRGVNSVIAIGQRSYALGKKLAKSLPVVHGGVMIEPNGHSGISLVADPHQFFDKLTTLAPSVKQVFTVYSDDSNGWLIRMAKETAAQYGIELHAQKAGSVREGMSLLRDTLDAVKGDHDAIWLLLDKVIPDKAALPIVLEKAWESRVVVFSNNPSHTRRGALFALFPDHQEMGARLGRLLIQQSQENARPLVLPSQDLKISINERTASHLGFSFAQNQRAEFDLIFPVR